ncbi:MAG: hypothetical protein GKC03_05255 [Methanomassiliicoccales archaeon]|nr:hypothetical protein [Methanomassiliicoccales archaeon]NYT15592.1 hypothetical protein [Methanomassiliicoccales archaeon]
MRRLVPMLLILLIAIALGFGGCLSLITGGGEDLGDVSGLELKETTVYIGLSWEPVEGAEYYQVFRDDSLITETSRLHYNDSDVLAGEDYCYRVRAAKGWFLSNLHGGLSEAVWGNLTPIDHDDPGFRAYDMDCYDLIMGMGYDFEEAGNAMDLGRIRLLTQKLENLCNDFLQESYLFNITPDLEPALDEYRLAMDDLINGCLLGLEGLDHLDQDKAYEGMDYITSGLEHLQNSVDFL